MGLCLSRRSVDSFKGKGLPYNTSSDSSQNAKRESAPPQGSNKTASIRTRETLPSVTHTVPDSVEVGNFSSDVSCYTNENSTRISEERKKIRMRNIRRLEELCPLATDEERERFLTAKDGSYDLALQQLTAYLDWREEYDVDAMAEQSQADICFSPDDDDEKTRDECDWIIASHAALSHYREKNKENGNYKQNTNVSTLPRLAQMVTLPDSDEKPMKTIEGNRIIQLLPAQMNPNIADEDTYTLSIAFYMERKLCRNDAEKIVVFIDLRSGDNWYNPRASTLIPFIKNVTACLGTNFPERLSKSILCPMPKLAMTLWKVVRTFLDPNTARKIVVIGGKSANDAKLPHIKLQKYIALEVIDQMEEARIEACEKAGSGALKREQSIQLQYWT